MIVDGALSGPMMSESTCGASSPFERHGGTLYWSCLFSFWLDLANGTVISTHLHPAHPASSALGGTSQDRRRCGRRPGGMTFKREFGHQRGSRLPVAGGAQHHDQEGACCDFNPFPSTYVVIHRRRAIVVLSLSSEASWAAFLSLVAARTRCMQSAAGGPTGGLLCRRSRLIGNSDVSRCNRPASATGPG